MNYFYKESRGGRREVGVVGAGGSDFFNLESKTLSKLGA